jgi:hypothetical protein
LRNAIVADINDYIMKRPSGFRGPSLTLLAIVHISIFVANLIVVATLRHGAPYVNPFAQGEIVRAFFAANARAVQAGSFFLFGSAVPFGIFTATIVSRLKYMGVRAAGTNIALFGGFSAAGALALSGCFGWVLSQPNVVNSIPLVQALCFLSFLFGGMAYAVTFGLLVAGVTVTCYLSHLLPRWLAAFGMLVALAGELSSLSLVFPWANSLIPIARYLGFIWMLIAAVRLSKEIHTLPGYTE